MTYVRKWLFEIFMAIVLLYAGSYTYYAFAPLNWWYYYEGIDVVEPVYHGEELKLISYIWARVEVNIEWRDELRCYGPNFKNDERVDIVNSDGVIRVQSPTDGIAWVWGKITVRPGNTCYIRSIQTVKFPYNIERTNIVRSETARIEGPIDG